MLQSGFDPGREVTLLFKGKYGWWHTCTCGERCGIKSLMGEQTWHPSPNWTLTLSPATILPTIQTATLAPLPGLQIAIPLPPHWLTLCASMAGGLYNPLDVMHEKKHPSIRENVQFCKITRCKVRWYCPLESAYSTTGVQCVHPTREPKLEGRGVFYIKKKRPYTNRSRKWYQQEH